MSLLGGQIWAQAAEYTHCLLTGDVPGRANYGHALIHGLYRIFETSDGWIALVGVPPSKLDAFFIAIGCPELSADPRFQGAVTREDLAGLSGELERIFKTRTVDEWCAALREAGVRYAPVCDYAEVVADAGVWDNGYLAEAPDDNGVVRRVVGTPIRMSDTPIQPAATAPELGEHADEILLEYGYTQDEIAALREEGAV